jgi:hypothetical protein
MSTIDSIGLSAGSRTGRLLIGRLDRSGRRYLEKRDAETEVLHALTDHMLRGNPDGAEKIYSLDGGETWFKLTIAAYEPPTPLELVWDRDAVPQVAGASGK